MIDDAFRRLLVRTPAQEFAVAKPPAAEMIDTSDTGLDTSDRLDNLTGESISFAGLTICRGRFPDENEGYQPLGALGSLNPKEVRYGTTSKHF